MGTSLKTLHRGLTSMSSSPLLSLCCRFVSLRASLYSISLLSCFLVDDIPLPLHLEASLNSSTPPNHADLRVIPGPFPRNTPLTLPLQVTVIAFAFTFKIFNEPIPDEFAATPTPPSYLKQLAVQYSLLNYIPNIFETLLLGTILLTVVLNSLVQLLVRGRVDRVLSGLGVGRGAHLYGK